MIGYHYTSYENWQRIKYDGLKLNNITKPELFPYLLKKTVRGIWVWTHELEQRDELGTLLWVLSKEHTYRVSKLEVHYERGELLTFFDELLWANRTFIMHHNGTIGDFEFHPGTPTAHIITVPVEADRVKCLQTFNFLSLVNQHKLTSKKSA